MHTKFVVNNSVPRTSGGKRFNNELKAEKMQKVLEDAASFIKRTLNKSPPKAIATVTLTVDTFNGIAETAGSGIRLSEAYIANYQAAGLVKEITGVLYHESVHVWQNNNGDYGNDKFFRGAIEGVADWIRLRADLASAGWPARTLRGGTWYDGSVRTAYFFEWIETNKHEGFVNELNQKMVQPWSEDFFREIVGEGVDKLWTEYQQGLSA